MTDYDLRTLNICQAIMRIDSTRLILGEIDGVLHLTNIMIQGTRTHQLRVTTYFASYLGSQIAHLNTVLERTRSHLAHASQQVLIHVAEFYERYVRNKAKELLEEIEHRITTKDDNTAYCQIDILIIVNLRKIIVTNHKDGQIGKHGNNCCEYGSPEQLRSA